MAATRIRYPIRGEWGDAVRSGRRAGNGVAPGGTGPTARDGAARAGHGSHRGAAIARREAMHG